MTVVGIFSSIPDVRNEGSCPDKAKQNVDASRSASALFLGRSGMCKSEEVRYQPADQRPAEKVCVKMSRGIRATAEGLVLSAPDISNKSK